MQTPLQQLCCVAGISESVILGAVADLTSAPEAAAALRLHIWADIIPPPDSKDSLLIHTLPVVWLGISPSMFHPRLARGYPDQLHICEVKVCCDRERPLWRIFTACSKTFSYAATECEKNKITKRDNQVAAYRAAAQFFLNLSEKYANT